MPPHGGGLIGATHSHNPEFPEDNWNLYTQLVPERTIGLNVTNRRDVVSVFKPYARRLSDPVIFSDGDAEIMIIAQFISPVHIRRIMVIGGGDIGTQSPVTLKCYVNHDNVDFTNIEAIRPAQTFTLPVNPDGTAELVTAVHPFTNVTSLVMFFPENYGHETTAIRYIGNIFFNFQLDSHTNGVY